MHNTKIDFPGKYIILPIGSDVKIWISKTMKNLRKSITKNIEQIILLNLSVYLFLIFLNC